MIACRLCICSNDTAAAGPFLLFCLTGFVMLGCVVTGGVSFDRLVKVCLWDVSTLKVILFLFAIDVNIMNCTFPILQPPDAKSWLIWKDPDAGKDWRWEEKGMTGWDGWIASLTQWTWVWVSSGSWWWAGKPGVLHFMGLQRVGHNWLTELNWSELRSNKKLLII